MAKSFDYTVIIGLDNNGDICLFNRFQKDWAQTKSDIVRTVGRLPALIDSTGVGDAIAEDLQLTLQMVEGFKFSSTSKQQLMEGLCAGIQQRKTSVLDGVHKDEMEAFEYEYTRTGVRYTAPQGVHDDTVCAHALAFKKYGEVSRTGSYIII